jgi:hypothetical protein
LEFQIFPWPDSTKSTAQKFGFQTFLWAFRELSTGYDEKSLENAFRNFF